MDGESEVDFPNVERAVGKSACGCRVSACGEVEDIGHALRDACQGSGRGEAMDEGDVGGMGRVDEIETGFVEEVHEDLVVWPDGKVLEGRVWGKGVD